MLKIFNGILSCHFIPKYDDFKGQIKVISDIATNKNIEAQNAVAEVTKLIQTKYPELTAEYSISDGGIIFINDETMEEFYGIEHVYEYFGKR